MDIPGVYRSGIGNLGIPVQRNGVNSFGLGPIWKAPLNKLWGPLLVCEPVPHIWGGPDFGRNFLAPRFLGGPSVVHRRGGGENFFPQKKPGVCFKTAPYFFNRTKIFFRGGRNLYFFFKKGATQRRGLLCRKKDNSYAEGALLFFLVRTYLAGGRH